MEVLTDVVDYFVVVESEMTHSGKLKPLHFMKAVHEGLYRGFEERILYYELRELQGSDSWARERYHRGAIGEVLRYHAKPGDMTIVADVDEIPNPKAVEALPATGGEMVLDLYYYGMNWHVHDGWSIGALPHGIEQDANKIRNLQGHSVPKISEPAGWHFSYMMSPDRIVEKLDAFMHHGDIAKDVPRDPAWIANRINQGKDLFGRDHVWEYRFGEGRTDLPIPVQNDPDRFRKLGWLK